MSNSRAFWLVWNPNGKNPQRRHDEVSAAISEAERLANQNPGEIFIVVESVCSRQVSQMQKIDFITDPDQVIPF